VDEVLRKRREIEALGEGNEAEKKLLL